MADDAIEAGIRLLEQDLDLGSGFLIRLWGESNAWTFVIKGHALLETALSDLLTGVLLNPKLQPVLDFLPMGGRIGKVAFLRAAGLLTASQQTFLDELQNLRNTLVHSVHNTGFDFSTFLATNPKDAHRLGAAAAGIGETPEIRAQYEAQFATSPRHVLWLAMLYVLAGSRSVLLKTEDERRALETRIDQLFRS